MLVRETHNRLPRVWYCPRHFRHSSTPWGMRRSACVLALSRDARPIHSLARPGCPPRCFEIFRVVLCQPAAQTLHAPRNRSQTGVVPPSRILPLSGGVHLKRQSDFPRPAHRILSSAHHQQARATLWRATRMARKQHVVTLEKKYARLKGASLAAERECEDLSGADLYEKWDEIESRQKIIQKIMVSISVVIRLEEPNWDGERIRAIVPRKNLGYRGVLSESFYEFLWAQDEEFTATYAFKKIKEIIENKGKRVDNNKYLRDQVAVFLFRLEGDLVRKIPGKPNKWVLDWDV